MCTEATAERILEAVRELPEEEAMDVLQRIDRGEEETIPWDGVKAEYGLRTLPTVSAFQGEPVEIQETLRRGWD